MSAELLIADQTLGLRVAAFRRAFPNLRVDSYALIVERDLVAARLTGSGTRALRHCGPEPQGRRAVPRRDSRSSSLASARRHQARAETERSHMRCTHVRRAAHRSIASTSALAALGVAVALCSVLFFAAAAPAQDLIAVAPTEANVVTKADAAKERLRLELLALEIALRPFVKDPEAKERFDSLVRCVTDRSTNSLVIGASPLAVRRGVAEALARCAAGLGFTLPGRGVSTYLSDHQSASTPTFSCATDAGDPRYSTPGTRTPKDWERKHYKLDSTQMMYTDQERELRRAEFELAETAAKATPEHKALQEAFKKFDGTAPGSPAREAEWPAINEAIKQWQATPEFKAMKEAEKRDSPFTAPLHSRVDPNAPNVCAAVAELAAQIGACAKADWRGGLCDKLRAQLAGCSDLAVTDPLPDQDTCSLTSAEDRQEDGAKLETAAVIACQMLSDYGPDGGDACRAAIGSDGPDEIDRNSARWAYTCWQMGVCSLVEVACRSALTQPGQDAESCAGKATLEALFPDIAVIIAEGITKIGGPGWIPPSTGGTGPLPGPGPETVIGGETPIGQP